MTDKVVLAYSGGLDTSVGLKWLQTENKVDVITVTVDVGQNEDLKDISRLAKSIGSRKHYSIDSKDEFARDYISPSIKANGLYQGVYPLATALSRPLIALKLVDVAHKEKANMVAHGCTGKGNDQIRFDTTIKCLDPNLKIIAPVREWNLSRDEEEKYAKKHGIGIKSKQSNYSIDQNIWGRSIEGGEIYDTEKEPPQDIFEWTTPLEKTLDNPGYIKIGFENGLPMSIDGTDMELVQIIKHLNYFAGIHGVGVIDHIEDRVIGIKSRELYECPAAVCIIESHSDLEKLVLTRHELSFKTMVDTQWAWLVYSGLWIEPLRNDLQSFIESTQRKVTGEVTLKLYKGGMRVVGRSSPISLYSEKLATYDSWSTFDQKDAEGFINLWSLPSRQAMGSSRKAERTPSQKKLSRPKKLIVRDKGV